MNDFGDKLLIGAAVKIIVKVALASLIAAGTADASLARAIVIVADIDTQLTRPALPDCLKAKPKAGAVALSPVTVAKRPVVQVFTTPGCPPCVDAKRELSRSKIPHVFMPKNPEWTETHGFPAMAWKTGETWHYQFGWNGLADFQKRYEATFVLEPPKAVAQAYRSGPHWTWPGDLGNHLVESHGYSREQVSRMSQSQREAAHDSAHNGYATTPKRRRGVFAGIFGTSSGGCPGGQCP